MNKQDYFNEFRDGKRDLFFIVTKDFDEELKERNMLFRKVDDTTTSVIGFVTREEAESFIMKVIEEKDNWKIAQINVMVFDNFLEGLDAGFRENLLFELI
ncbi:MAG: hypothetical protein JXA07_04405 [Spirochaetes bacterium]|nr:hypothetical protein [Spirochaetota bacterium]